MVLLISIQLQRMSRTLAQAYVEVHTVRFIDVLFGISRQPIGNSGFGANVMTHVFQGVDSIVQEKLGISCGEIANGAVQMAFSQLKQLVT